VAIITIEAVDYSVNIMLNPSYYKAVLYYRRSSRRFYIEFSTARKIIGNKVRLKEIQ
jgi:hypothetical protein